MFPYNDDEKKLEGLLESLFSDDQSTTEEVIVLKGPRPPQPFGNCCTYSYTDYGG